MTSSGIQNGIRRNGYTLWFLHCPDTLSFGSAKEKRTNWCMRVAFVRNELDGTIVVRIYHWDADGGEWFAGDRQINGFDISHGGTKMDAHDARTIWQTLRSQGFAPPKDL